MSEPGKELCSLCETLEAETRDWVENDETGEAVKMALCGPCREKLLRYTRGEDVDFSDELRLPREDDGLRADGGIGVDDLDECWCCGGLHDAVGALCPACSDAGCQHFGGDCDADHTPVLPDGGKDGWICDRCGEPMDRGHPLDAVVHPNEGAVCDDCVEPWDEVVDV